MPGSVERAYQLHLGEKTPKEVWDFDAKKVIYPYGSYRGSLLALITAEDTKKKRGKYTIFRSLTKIVLYFDYHEWTLREGTLFEALKSQGRKRKIT